MENKPISRKTSSFAAFELSDLAKENPVSNGITEDSMKQFKKSHTLLNLYSQFILKNKEIYSSVGSLSQSNSGSINLLDSDKKHEPDQSGLVFEVQKDFDSRPKATLKQNNHGFLDRFLKSGQTNLNNKEINALAPGSL